MPPALATVLRHIDAPRLIDDVVELIRIPSTPGAETSIQRHLADDLTARGLHVETFNIDVDELSHDAWFSAEVDRSDALGVIATFGEPAGAGGHLLFNGHVDVVPAGDLQRWHVPPFAGEVRDGRIVGRGACDMKGGLAAAIHAVDAVVRAGITLAGSVTIAPVVGEEDGGTGTLALLRHGISADACVIPEPSGLQVVPAVAGALSWRIRVPGRAAHGCLREEGVSALENLWPIQQAVAQFEQVVAAACVQHPWLAQHPAQIEWWGGQFYPGATSVDAPIVQAVQSAAEHVTNPVQVRGVPYGCDLGLMTNVGGIDTVVWGPGDIRDAHSADESVAVDELVAAARGYAHLIVNVCGVAGELDVATHVG